MWWIVALIAAAIFAVGYFVFPASIKGTAPDPATLEDFGYPTASEDRVLTKVYGTCLIEPNLIWYGDLVATKRKKDDQTIGYGYTLSMIWAIGGPIQSVKQLRLNDDIVIDWTGVIDVSLATASWTKSTKRLVQTGAFTSYTWASGDKISITGGDSDELVEGIYTIASKVDDDTIALDQEICSEDTTNVTSDPKTGYGKTGISAEIKPTNTISKVVWTDGTHSSIPAYFTTQIGKDTIYKGVSLLLMESVFVGDDVRSVPAYSLVVKNCPRLLQAGDPTNYSEITDDSNPVDVLYDLYVNELGIASSLIDTTSWEASQETLYTEGFGVAIPMNRAKVLEEWQKEILRHIDAHIYWDEATAKFKFKLVRADFVAGSLPVVTKAHYRDLEFERSGWDGVFSDLIVKWTSRKDYQLTTYNLVNPANRDILGQYKQETLTFQFFTRSACAARRLAMIKERYFLPIASLSFKVSRNALSDLSASLYPGDVFKLTSAALGITEMICRVVGYSDTDKRSAKGYVEVEAMEDFSEFDENDIPAIPEPTLPESDILDSPVRFPLVLGTPRALAHNDSKGSLMAFGVKPASGATTEYDLHNSKIYSTGGITGGRRWYRDRAMERLSYCGYGTLKAEFAESPTGEMDAPYYSPGGFVIENPVNITNRSLTDAQWQALQQCYLLVPAALDDSASITEGFEIVAVKVTATSGSDKACTYVLRGVGGTTPMTHPIGTKAYQLPATMPDGEICTELIDYGGFTGDQPYGFTPVNNAGEGPLVTTTDDVYKLRAVFPLPPGNLKGWRFSTEGLAEDYAAGGSSAPDGGEIVLLAWHPFRREGSEFIQDDDFFEEREEHEGMFLFAKESGGGSLLAYYGTKPREGDLLVRDFGEFTEEDGRYIIFDSGSLTPIELKARTLSSGYSSEWSETVTI